MIWGYASTKWLRTPQKAIKLNHEQAKSLKDPAVKRLKFQLLKGENLKSTKSNVF
jgi:hypothetical protein